MRICSHRSLLFGIYFAAVALMLGVLAADRSDAAESDVFTVAGVAVDNTADSATKARELALEQGHSLAFEALLEKIVLREDRPRVPVLSANQLAALVLDFAVESERISPVRYLAELSFRFKPDETKRFLRGNGIGFAETESKPLLVLPLFGPAGQTQLWDQPNPWFEVWAARRARHALVPLMVPLGDLSDVAAIDAAGALAGDDVGLGQLRQRYGVGDSLVTQAILNGDPALHTASLMVITRRYGSVRARTIIESYSQGPEETFDDLLRRSLTEVVAEVQENWKRDNLLQFGKVQHIMVNVNAQRLEDWLDIKRRLDGLAAVESARITELRRGRSEIDVAYVGDERQLTVALAQRDLELLQGPDLAWELRLKPAASRDDGLAPKVFDGGADDDEPAAEDVIPAYQDELPSTQGEQLPVSE